MTIRDCLVRAAEERPTATALQYKRDGVWKQTSFNVLRERVWHVCEMLNRLGVEPGDRVALYRDNSPEWYELYFGIVCMGAVAVPVDAKLREQEVAHVLHDCAVSVAFCSARLFEVLAGVSSRIPALKDVVALDCKLESPVPCETIRFHVYEDLWQQITQTAQSDERAFDRLCPTEESPASFIYTSGTTGRPKGAVLTHRNFIANVESIMQSLPFTPDDNVLLILPLHHSFAFTTSLMVPIYAQCRVTIVENLRTIKANMQETAPTIMLAVPLLLEKMLARMQEGINAKAVARTLCRVGLTRVVGRQVHNGLGGALRLIVSGGAPISPSTLLGWTKLGFKIIEGYGITETAPVLSANPLDAPRVGTVGRPLKNVEIEILDPNPEGVGEIIARGENVMQGYYNNAEETAKVLVDGWYHTGDLGYFDEKGYLVISGRKKSLIVNREGKNIYPEEVERQVLKSRYVLECLAMGYREPHEQVGERVGLILVPDLEIFETMEDREGKRLSDQQIEELVREDVRKKLSALTDYKRPRRVEVRFDEFEKTTTQKIKRYLYAIDTVKGDER